MKNKMSRNFAANPSSQWTTFAISQKVHLANCPFGGKKRLLIRISPKRPILGVSCIFVLFPISQGLVSGETTTRRQVAESKQKENKVRPFGLTCPKAFQQRRC